MNPVQPIKDPEVVSAVAEFLRFTSERNYLMFCLGVYSGLRVSDLLSLQVFKVRGTHIEIIEGKTKKKKKFVIHDSIREDLDAYIADLDDNDYLFSSRQKKSNSGLPDRPIDRSMAYKILNQAAQHFGLKDIGCHTMRKTFGYQLIVNAEPQQAPFIIALLMKIYNHSTEAMTLHYLGLTQGAMDKAIQRMSYPKKTPISHSIRGNRKRA